MLLRYLKISEFYDINSESDANSYIVQENTATAFNDFKLDVDRVRKSFLVADRSSIK